MKEKFLNDLNAWLPTDYHRNDCIAYGEGQLCCLDDAQRGRQFVTEWLEKNLNTYILIEAGHGHTEWIFVSHSKEEMVAEIDKHYSGEVELFDEEDDKNHIRGFWYGLREMVKQHTNWEPGQHVLEGIDPVCAEWTLVIVG